MMCGAELDLLRTLRRLTPQASYQPDEAVRRAGRLGRSCRATGKNTRSRRVGHTRTIVTSHPLAPPRPSGRSLLSAENERLQRLAVRQAVVADRGTVHGSGWGFPQLEDAGWHHFGRLARPQLCSDEDAPV
jgi:hypothetical protein